MPSNQSDCNTSSLDRSMNTSGHQMTLQDGKKGTEGGQTKAGKTHVDYWYGKLKKRYYRGRDGQMSIPSFKS
jgi:hypothetical protein